MFGFLWILASCTTHRLRCYLIALCVCTQIDIIIKRAGACAPCAHLHFAHWFDLNPSSYDCTQHSIRIHRFHLTFSLGLGSSLGKLYFFLIFRAPFFLSSLHLHSIYWCNWIVSCNSLVDFFHHFASYTPLSCRYRLYRHLQSHREHDDADEQNRSSRFISNYLQFFEHLLHFSITFFRHRRALPNGKMQETPHQPITVQKHFNGCIVKKVCRRWRWWGFVEKRILKISIQRRFHKNHSKKKIIYFSKTKYAYDSIQWVRHTWDDCTSTSFRVENVKNASKRCFTEILCHCNRWDTFDTAKKKLKFFCHVKVLQKKKTTKFNTLRSELQDTFLIHSFDTLKNTCNKRLYLKNSKGILQKE